MDKKGKEILRLSFEKYLQRKIDDYFIRGYLKEKPLEERLIYLQEVLELTGYYINAYHLPKEEADH